MPRLRATPSKAELDALRARTLAGGLSRQQVRDAMMRRYGFRPREAWRHALGWSQDQLATEFNLRCDRDGRAPMSGTRIGAYERWPQGGERPTIPTLRAVAAVFGVALGQVVDDDDLAHMPEEERRTLLDLLRGTPAAGAIAGGAAAGGVAVTPAHAGPDLPAAAGAAYLRLEMADLDPAGTEREVVMAAHEGSEHAERAERRDIGDATLEQLRADVVRLSRDYMTGEPFPLFQEMRRVRGRMYTALDRRLWPRDATELYFLLGGVNGLMACAAEDLGYPQAAEELVRAGWAYAVAIDHRPLMGYLRARLASISLWEGRPRQARYLALDGLRYLPAGTGAARLHLIAGQAAAESGDAEGTSAAVTAAAEARETQQRDGLHDDIGGQFGFSRAKQAYLAGSALGVASGGEIAAIGQLRDAVQWFEAGPVEDRSYGCEALAHINLARALLRNGELEAVDLRAVFELPPDKRIAALPQRFGLVRTELARPRYSGAALASDLDERIEDFTRDTIVGDLRELP